MHAARRQATRLTPPPAPPRRLPSAAPRGRQPPGSRRSVDAARAPIDLASRLGREARWSSDGGEGARPLMRISPGPVGAQERQPGPNPVGGWGRGVFGQFGRHELYRDADGAGKAPRPSSVSPSASYGQLRRSARHMPSVIPAPTVVECPPPTRAGQPVPVGACGSGLSRRGHRQRATCRQRPRV